MPTRKSLDAGILAAALEGLALQQERLEQSIAEVRRLLSGTTRKAAVAGGAKRPRRKLSVAARKRISVAMKRRWTEFRKRKTAAAKK